MAERNANLEAGLAASEASAATEKQASDARIAEATTLLAEHDPPFDLIQIPADGRCLFSAVSLELFGAENQQENADILRQLAIQEIKHNEGQYSITDDEDNPISINAYIEKYSKHDAYGGQNEIKALSKITNRVIHVLQKDARNGTVLDNHTYYDATHIAEKKEGDIYLWYYKSQGFPHYDAIKEKDKELVPLESDVTLTGPTRDASAPEEKEDDLALVTSLFLLAASAVQPPSGSTVLGSFRSAVKRAASAVQPPSGSTVLGSFRSAVERAAVKGRTVEAAGQITPGSRRAERIPPPEPRWHELPISARNDLQYLLNRRRPTPTIKGDDATVKAGDMVGVYAMWGDKLLIYKKKADGQINVPTRVVEAGQTHKMAGISVLQDETNLTPQDLVEFKRVKDGDKTSVFFYAIFTDKPAVQGAADTMDPFDFIAAGIKGEGAAAGAASPALLFWAPLLTLRMWLVDAKHNSYRDPTFLDNLRTLAKTLHIKTKVEEDDLPQWSAGLFNSNNIKPACKGSTIVTRDCIAKTVRADIFAADEFSKDGRLATREADAELIEYQRLVKELAGPNSIAAALKLHYRYPDRSVYIRDPVTKQIHKRVVPNPYKALSYREDTVTNFRHPNGVSAADKDGVMLKRNIQLLQDLVPPQLIADKAMAISILESLWFCGQNPTISNDPRCFPARLLGELREYAADKIQMSQAVEANAVLQNSDWPWLKIMLADLRGAIAGSQTYEFTQDLSPQKLLKKPATVPATVPAAKPATVPKPRASPLGPMATGVRIVPRQLGGAGFRPILPGRSLGVLPPLVRT